MSSVFTLSSRPYLDTTTQNYVNVVVLNHHPQGPLEKMVRQTKFAYLSPFQRNNNNNNNYYSCNNNNLCALTLVSPCNNKLGIMTVDEVPTLYSFLLSNGYTIDTSLTKMTMVTGIQFQSDNRLIAFVKYQP
jgi:hypothetical protein